MQEETQRFFDEERLGRLVEEERNTHDVNNCDKCRLRLDCTAPVPGYGNIHSPIMIIGEAPGVTEDIKGKPFVGNSGQDLDMYLRSAGLSRSDCYITNLVKCHPAGNRNPKDDEIKACKKFVSREIELSTADAIITLGTFASRYILGDWLKIEVHHGLLFEKDGRHYMPMYHPAAGLHQTGMMMFLLEDFASLKQVLKGKYKARIAEKLTVENTEFEADYQFITDGEENKLKKYLKQGLGDNGRYVVSVDTETTKFGMYCMSLSTQIGSAAVIEANEVSCLEVIAEFLARDDVDTLIHNALFDLPVLEKVGIVPKKVYDTMVMSYLLQIYPQGLKGLCDRLFAIPMTSYAEIVGQYTQDKAIDYLIKAAEITYPKPEEVWVEQPDGTLKKKKPQGLNTKLKRMFTDFSRRDNVDILKRFLNWSDEERCMVEEHMGYPLEASDLSEVVKEDPDTVLEYSAKDADGALRVFYRLWDELNKLDLLSALEIDCGIIQIVSDMQKHGMFVNRKFMRRLGIDVKAQMQVLQAQIDEIAGYSVNVNSPLQMAKLLYVDLQLTVLKRTDNGAPSTGAMCLRPLVKEHVIVDKILKYRECKKLLGTYIEPLLFRALDSKESRIHPSIRTTRTSTGRLATSNPNMMAIPTRTEAGKKIREAFVAPENCVLMTCDYSQIEMRMVAHLAKDEAMTAMFIKGEDIHKMVASNVFGIPPSEVTDMQRYVSKRVGFGVLYGLGASGLYDQLNLEGIQGWSVAGCQDMIDNWFRLFWGIAEYFEKKRREAKRYGYVREDIYGRIRRIPEIKSSFKGTIQSGERRACSMAIQGAAQQVMKTAMINITPVYKGYLSKGFTCWPLIQIHDDIVWEVSESIAEKFKEDLHKTMTQCIKLTVPVEVDIKIGKCWGKLQKSVEYFAELLEEEEAEAELQEIIEGE